MDMCNMDMSDAVGQLLMVGIPHPTLDSETRDTLHDLKPGGVILFARNYTNPETLQALCTDLHSLQPDNPICIALDHEGGRVHRLAPPFTHFPPALRLGETDSSQLAYEVGCALGHELRSVGIDLDFAPVLDVFTNPHNTVIGDRAFGSDPQRVARLGCALTRGLRQAGIIPCGKHFPGHGATMVDSHEDLPRDEREKDRIENVDLVPFQAAIAEQIELIMTAHVVYPAYDPEQPASLSSIVMHNLLRQDLGFQGLIVSDDLEMGAITRHSSVGDATVQALGAGADLVLICQSLERACSAREACLRALRLGTLSATRLQESRQRLLQLKQRFAARSGAEIRPIGAPEHQALAAEILRQANG